MFDLTGKTALITGATGGIGGSIAAALHAQGATVGITGRNRDKLDLLAGQLKERVYVFAADLSDTDAISALVKEAEEAMGQIDILVNNAGLTRDNLSMRMKDEEWQEVLDVNLTAPFKLARSVQRGMMKRRFGRIINISSVVGTTGIGPVQLRGLQSGHERLDQIHGHGDCFPRHYGELHRAGLYFYGHDRGAHARSKRKNQCHDSDGPHGVCGRYCGGGGVSGQ